MSWHTSFAVTSWRGPVLLITVPPPIRAFEHFDETVASSVSLNLHALKGFGYANSPSAAIRYWRIGLGRLAGLLSPTS